MDPLDRLCFRTCVKGCTVAPLGWAIGLSIYGLLWGLGFRTQGLLWVLRIWDLNGAEGFLWGLRFGKV